MGQFDSLSHLFHCLYFNQRRLVKQMMATIFRVDLCHNLTLYKAYPSLGVFCGEKNVLKALEDTKKQKALIKNSLLTTKIPGKSNNKSRGNRGKKPAAWGTKPKGKGKGAQKKARAKPKPKAASNNKKDKEASSTKGKSYDEPCKFTFNNITSCYPFITESCKFGTSMDDTVASISWSLDWPVSFPLQSATEYVSALNLNP